MTTGEPCEEGAVLAAGTMTAREPGVGTTQAHRCELC
jgi:hypothetical protein